MMMLKLLLLPLLIGLNRARGDDTWMFKGLDLTAGKWLPGRSLYYVAGVVALLAAVFLPLYAGLAFGLGYLLWGIPPWGRWFDMGRLADGYAREGLKMTPFEEAITWLTFGGDDAVAMFWRHCLVAPGLALTGYLLGHTEIALWTPAFATLIVGSYELAWRWRPAAPIILAELLTGGVWALMLLAVWLYI